MADVLNSRSYVATVCSLSCFSLKPTEHFLSYSLPGEDQRNVHQIAEMDTGVLREGTVFAHHEPPPIG